MSIICLCDEKKQQQRLGAHVSFQNFQQNTLVAARKVSKVFITKTPQNKHQFISMYKFHTHTSLYMYSSISFLPYITIIMLFSDMLRLTRSTYRSSRVFSPVASLFFWNVCVIPITFLLTVIKRIFLVVVRSAVANRLRLNVEKKKKKKFAPACINTRDARDQTVNIIDNTHHYFGRHEDSARAATGGGGNKINLITHLMLSKRRVLPINTRTPCSKVEFITSAVEAQRCEFVFVCCCYIFFVPREYFQDLPHPLRQQNLSIHLHLKAMFKIEFITRRQCCT